MYVYIWVCVYKYYIRLYLYIYIYMYMYVCVCVCVCCMNCFGHVAQYGAVIIRSGFGGRLYLLMFGNPEE